MVRRRIFSAIGLGMLLGGLPLSAGRISHAMEVTDDGSVLFVDIERGRLLRYHDGSLSVASELSGVAGEDAMQNLIRAIDGELYLGQKKTVWTVSPTGEVEAVKPPGELKNLFKERPGDLAPDGSVYVARDFRNIERALPGGDSHPVLVTDVISKIHTIAVTPYGRVFFANNSEIAKLDAEGEVAILQQIEGEKIFGLAAVGESAVLVLRQKDGEGLRLEHLDLSGNIRQVASADHIASVKTDQPVQITAAN